MFFADLCSSRNEGEVYLYYNELRDLNDSLPCMHLQ
jgi:hypothetical protein